MTIPSTIIAGLIVGAILTAAQWISPLLMPWVLGYMIACLAKNLRSAVVKGNLSPQKE